MKHIHLIKSTAINALVCIIVALSPLKSEVYDGNLLISPKDIQNQIFRTSLIDNNYNIINTWETDCPVASMGYLLPDSTLIFPCAQDNPIFNTTLLFTTSEVSYHGFPKLMNLPNSRSRNSIALYYYTSREVQVKKSTLTKYKEFI